MRPAPFSYSAPSDLGEALRLLAGPGAKVLAGGQSLVPLLNLRLARPSLLVDIGGVRELESVERAADGAMRLGALVRHRALGEGPIRAALPLLSQAAAHIGHNAIRVRGTLGGSLAHADPTAELPLACVALRADLVVRSMSGGERVVPAEDFFLGPYTTVLSDEEILLEARFAPRPMGEGTAFLEVAPRSGDFAIVAVAAVCRVVDGHLLDVRLAWAGAELRPVVPTELMEGLRGAAVGGNVIERLCLAATARLSPPSDIRASGEYRRSVLSALTARALRDAALQGGRPS